MTVSDSELRQLAFDFVKACFSHLRKDWSLPNVPGRYLLVGRDYSYFGISDLPQYQAFFDCLAQDKIIQQVYERKSGGLNDGTLDKYIVRLFVKVLHDSNGEPSPKAFEQWFEEFKGEIFKPTTILKRVWFLENFKCTENEVEINDELKIRYFPHGAVQQALEKDIEPWLYWTLPHLFGHALVLTQAVDKRDAPYITGSSSFFYKLSSFVTALRLFKSGFIDTRYSLDLELGEFPQDSQSIYERHFLGDPFSSKYILQDSEIEPLIRFWKEIYEYLFQEGFRRTTNSNRLRLAITYFESSYGKPWDEALVDLTISLEALLLDGESHQKENLQKRVAGLVGADPLSRIQIKEDIGTMYDLRSDVVHGKVFEGKEFEERLARLTRIEARDFTFDKGLEAIEKCREYARKVICRLITPTSHNGVELGKPYFAGLGKRA